MVHCCVFRLYSDPKQRPRYNLLFILSGGGHFNYFGTKGLLEEQLDDPGIGRRGSGWSLTLSCDCDKLLTEC